MWTTMSDARAKHSCKLPCGRYWQDAYYGPAISDCEEDDEGRFWADNGEYSSQVNYCPVCGVKARAQIEVDDE